MQFTWYSFTLMSLEQWDPISDSINKSLWRWRHLGKIFERRFERRFWAQIECSGYLIRSLAFSDWIIWFRFGMVRNLDFLTGQVNTALLWCRTIFQRRGASSLYRRFSWQCWPAFLTIQYNWLTPSAGWHVEIWFCKIKNDLAVSFGSIDLCLCLPLDFCSQKINLFRGGSRGSLQGLISLPTNFSKIYFPPTKNLTWTRGFI